MSDERRDDEEERDRKPGSPGVVGQQPNRFEDPDEVAALDESPDGMNPTDTTDSSEESLPPG